ncbi:MAG: FAD-binding protein, partial [Chromatiales bacterium]|nr:FAD-binding protein [Chromatiales bacterium]
SRGIYAQMRDGHTTPHGGVYIEMKHLGPEKVARQFKGMVTRCVDCGFDLAGGRVEVVPTAHYMMGGAVFEEDTSCAIHGLFLAGEDSGGVHGANRLGGNGVANSTVFGGIAGETMATFVAKEGLRDADQEVLSAAAADVLRPFDRRGGNLNDLRLALQDLMWDKVGILRDKAGLETAITELDALSDELEATGLADSSPVFNLTWHDWLNLESQLLISKTIARASLARQDSRGAHFREDFPETLDLESSRYTVVEMSNGQMSFSTEPVDFCIVKPGDSLIDGEAGAPPSAAARG